MIALDCTVLHLLASIQKSGITPPITIFSDCKSALQVLYNLYPRSGQFFITQITLKVHKIKITQQSQVSFERSFGHSKILSNDQTYILGQNETTVAEVYTNNPFLYLLLQSVALKKEQKLYLVPTLPWVKLSNKKFTLSIDKAIPGKHK